MISLNWIKLLNKFLLTSDKFMPEMQLKQPRFTYGTCGPLTKYRERIQKFRETGNLNIYIGMNYTKHVLIMMQHILIVRGTISDKNLKNKAYEIAVNCKYDETLASMVYKFFHKKQDREQV